MEKKPAVLVVEDDPNIRSALHRLMEKQGYTVFSVGDGDKALHLVGSADVVILDLFLPKISGQDFLQKVRSAGNYVPVIVMSGSMDRDEGTEALKEFGIVDFMPKPFSSAEMISKVEKAVKVCDDLNVVQKATDQLKGFIERQTHNI